MQANDRTLAHYLFEHRASPSQEFSAQVDAFCEQLIQREGRTGKAKRNARRSKRTRNPAMRALSIAASVLVIFALSIMAIPSAKAAVSEWVNNLFHFEDYLGQTSENRSGEPELDSVITKIENDGRQITISDIGSSEEARRLAENFGIRLDEVLYSGKDITITGWLTGTAGKFTLDERTGGDTVHEDSEYTEGLMRLTLSDGRVFNGVVCAYFDEEMERICSESPLEVEPVYDDKGRLLTTNAAADLLWYEWLKTHEVRFVMTATPEDTRAKTTPLTGHEVASLSFHEYYRDTKAAALVTLFKADLGTVSIDADAYTAVTTEQSGGQAVSLSGTHRMYIHERETLPTGCFVHSYVKDLDFSGVSIAVDSVKFTPTGLDVILRMDLPQAWSRPERLAAIQGGENGGIAFAIQIDGEQIQHAFLSISAKINADTDNKDDPFLTSQIVFSNSTLSRSQWDAVKTISFIPVTGWPTELILEDLLHDRQELERIKLDPGVVVTEQADVTGTMRADWIEDRMDDAAITIQLDDYR